MVKVEASSEWLPPAPPPLPGGGAPLQLHSSHRPGLIEKKFAKTEQGWPCPGNPLLQGPLPPQEIPEGQTNLLGPFIPRP